MIVMVIVETTAGCGSLHLDVRHTNQHKSGYRPLCMCNGIEVARVLVISSVGTRDLNICTQMCGYPDLNRHLVLNRFRGSHKNVEQWCCAYRYRVLW